MKKTLKTNNKDLLLENKRYQKEDKEFLLEYLTTTSIREKSYSNYKEACYKNQVHNKCSEKTFAIFYEGLIGVYEQVSPKTLLDWVSNAMMYEKYNILPYTDKSSNLLESKLLEAIDDSTYSPLKHKKLLEKDGPKEDVKASLNRMNDLFQGVSFDDIEEEQETDLDYVLNSFKDMKRKVNSVIRGTSQNRHLIVSGAPGVGKSFIVIPYVEDVLAPKYNKTVELLKGASGNSLSDIIPLLWRNRNPENIIILDDADTMFSGKKPEISNLLKGALDPGKALVSVPGNIRMRINKRLKDDLPSSSSEEMEDEIMEDEDMMESFIKNLYENVFYSLLEDEDIAEIVPKKRRGRPAGSKNKNTKAKEPEVEAPEGYLVPSSFEFQGTMIVLSNLSKSQIDSAVLNRMDVVDLHFNQPQLIAYIQYLTPNLKFSKLDQIFKPLEKQWIVTMGSELLGAIFELGRNGQALSMPFYKNGNLTSKKAGFDPVIPLSVRNYEQAINSFGIKVDAFYNEVLDDYPEFEDSFPSIMYLNPTESLRRNMTEEEIELATNTFTSIVYDWIIRDLKPNFV